MAGKIRAALVRKEAETYRAHGLHREAQAMYRDLLESAANIEPQLRDAVRQQIELIRACERSEEADLRCRRLTGELIAILKSGWGDRPTESDHLVCAHALMELERPVEALEEFAQLLRRGTAIELIAPAAARCLADLHPPAGLPAAVARFSREAAPGPSAAEAIARALQEALAAGTGTGLREGPAPRRDTRRRRLAQAVRNALRSLFRR
jgi:hypothetical protein